MKVGFFFMLLFLLVMSWGLAQDPAWLVGTWKVTTAEATLNFAEDGTLVFDTAQNTQVNGIWQLSEGQFILDWSGTDTGTVTYTFRQLSDSSFELSNGDIQAGTVLIFEKQGASLGTTPGDTTPEAQTPLTPTTQIPNTQTPATPNAGANAWLLSEWKATANAVEYTFVFNADGTYTFSTGDYLETGTYTVDGNTMTQNWNDSSTGSPMSVTYDFEKNSDTEFNFSGGNLEGTVFNFKKVSAQPQATTPPAEPTTQTTAPEPQTSAQQPPTQQTTTQSVPGQSLAAGATTNFSQYTGTLTYQNTDEVSYYDRQYYVYDLDLKTGASAPLYAAASNATVFKAKTGEVLFENDVSDLIIRKPNSPESIFIEVQNYTQYPIQGVMSDDGQRIAYTRHFGVTMLPPEALQVEVVDLSKTSLVTFRDYYAPAWSPDGRLVMVGKRGVYITDANLGNLQQIGPAMSDPGMPSVSPDGSKVAFVADGQVFTMNLDGSNLKQITASGNRVYWPSWSPDGQHIVVTANTGLYENAIVIIPADPAQPTYIDDSLVLQIKDGRKTFFLEANNRVTWR